MVLKPPNSFQREPRPAPHAVGSLFQQFASLAIFLSDANPDRETAWQEARGRVMPWAKGEGVQS